MSSKSIFITGAANGIGKAISLKFAAAGWYVGLSDIDANGLEELKQQTGSDKCITLPLNVTSETEWQECLARFYEFSGGLDVLVNNAGVLESGAFEDIPFSKQQSIIDINVKGVLAGCHSAFPYLKKTQGSRIINLCSASAIYGQPSLATYSASKFAIKGLTEALNLEWEKKGIYVTDMLPLFVKTNMVDDMDAQAIKKLGVNLTADDIAESVYEVSTNKIKNHKVHWPVGMSTKAFYLLADLSPAFMNRFFNKRITLK